jgi:hypothetical protein
VAARLVAALEACWRAIRRHHPEIPPAMLVVAAGFDARRHKLGHFAAERWRHARKDGALPEVLIGGEGLERGPEPVFATLLHEAAHALADAREIQDTSRQGRYHNLRASGRSPRSSGSSSPRRRHRLVSHHAAGRHRGALPKRRSTSSRRRLPSFAAPSRPPPRAGGRTTTRSRPRAPARGEFGLPVVTEQERTLRPLALRRDTRLATSGEAHRPWPKTRNAAGGLIADSAGHTATALPRREQWSPNRRDNAARGPTEHSTSLRPSKETPWAALAPRGTRVGA